MTPPFLSDVTTGRCHATTWPSSILRNIIEPLHTCRRMISHQGPIATLFLRGWIGGAGAAMDCPPVSKGVMDDRLGCSPCGLVYRPGPAQGRHNSGGSARPSRISSTRRRRNAKLQTVSAFSLNMVLAPALSLSPVGSLRPLLGLFLRRLGPLGLSQGREGRSEHPGSSSPERTRDNDKRPSFLEPFEEHVHAAKVHRPGIGSHTAWPPGRTSRQSRSRPCSR